MTTYLENLIKEAQIDFLEYERAEHAMVSTAPFLKLHNITVKQDHPFCGKKDTKYSWIIIEFWGQNRNRLLAGTNDGDGLALTNINGSWIEYIEDLDD